MFEKIHHAYLFFGPEGAANKEKALALVRFCEGGDAFQDVLFFEHTTIGIDEVREIKRFLFQTPIRSKRRICVIDGAERLSWQAAPALLKIVEEPPEQSLVIMTAREKDVLSPALLSRCVKMYVPPTRNVDMPKYRNIESAEPSLAEEIEQRIITLYRGDRIRNAKTISFLLRKLEMSRFNLNPKLQKKAIEYYGKF